MLNIYKMVVASFWITNKANWVKFFEKIFMVANISLYIVFDMPFLTLGYANVDFLDQKFRYKIYITYKVFLTIIHIKLIEREKVYNCNTLAEM